MCLYGRDLIFYWILKVSSKIFLNSTSTLVKFVFNGLLNVMVYIPKQKRYGTELFKIKKKTCRTVEGNLSRAINIAWC